MATITNERLADLIVRNTPEVIPPCRVCGGPLSIQSAGSGEIVWGCNNVRTEAGVDWKHYEGSRHRQCPIGDGDVDVDVVSALTELQSLRSQAGVSEAVAEIDTLLDNCHVVEDIDIAAQHEAVKVIVRSLAARPAHIEITEVGVREAVTWETHKVAGEATVHSVVIGGILCRWWGDTEPEGVSLLNNIRPAPIEITEAAERAFKDGLAYGSNVRNADPDIAWGNSAIRAALQGETK